MKNPYIKVAVREDDINVLNSIYIERSKFYSLQSIIGVLGVLLIFLSYKNLNYIFIGFILLLIRFKWRKKTDRAAYLLNHTKTLYKRKKYKDILPYIIELSDIYPDNRDLQIIKAECFLYNKEYEEAFLLYKKYILDVILNKGDEDAQNVLQKESHVNNLLYLLIIKEEFENTLAIEKILKNRKGDDFFSIIWRNYYMGILTYKIGEMKSAKKYFQNVYKMDSRFDDIEEVIKRVTNNESIEELLVI